MDLTAFVTGIVSGLCGGFASFKIMDVKVNRLEEEIKRMVSAEKCNLLHARSEEKNKELGERLDKMDAKLEEMRDMTHKIANKLKVDL